MGNSAKLQIIIDAVNNAQDELKTLQNELGGVEKSAKKGNKGIGEFFKTVGAYGATTAATFAAIGAASKKAFDFGKEGAIVSQTTESFDRLGLSIEDLRDASRGTVDDMTLMSSTMTLVTGVTGDLKQSMLDAAPQLLEIAKAANKANPELGSTAFMYESIMTGVKRAQPLILDNLGLTIKVGEANQAMAEKLGKSVQELTSEERAMAILNGTLEAGQIIINDVGGDVSALTDEYDRMEVAIKNAADAGKQKFNVWLAEQVQKINAVIYKIDVLNDLLEDHSDAALEAGMGWKEYARQQAWANETAGEQQRVQNAVTEQMIAAGAATEEITRANLDYAYALDVAISNGWGFNETLSASEYAQLKYYQAVEDTTEAQYGGLTAAVQYKQVTKETGQAAADAAISFNDAAAGISEMSKAQVAQSLLDSLAEAGLKGEAYAEAQQAILMGYGVLTEEELKAQATLNDLTAAYINGTVSLDEYIVRTQLATDAAQNEAAAANITADAHRQYQDALGGTAGQLSAVAQEAAETDRILRNMIAYREIRIDINRYYNDYGDNATQDRFDQYQQYQAAGGVSYGGRIMTGEHGPEMITPPVGSRVQPITNNITVNNSFAPGTTVPQSTDIWRAMLQ